MNKPLLISTTLFVLIFSSCRQKSNCTEFNQNFSSYEEAKSKIKNASFKISEQVNTEKSTWVEGASFYSCDGEIGYFLLETKNKEYLYTNMPYKVWNDFKNSTSFGKFYNLKIKHKYQLELTNEN